MEGRGGDEGTDSFIGRIDNQKCIFQFKYFVDKLENKHWTKIRKSLKLSAKKYPEKWVLMIASDFTVGDWKKWTRLESQYESIKLELWSKSHLESLILEYRDKLVVEFQELFPTLEVMNSYRTILAQQHMSLNWSDEIDTQINGQERGTFLKLLKKFEDNFLITLTVQEKGRIRIGFDRYENLLKNIGIEVEAQETNVRSLSRLALYHLNSNNNEEANFILDIILREYPEDLRSLNNKAVSLDKREYLQEALNLLSRALSIYPEYLDARINQAAILMEVDQPKEGLRLLQEMYDHNEMYQSNKYVLEGMVHGYSLLGDVDNTFRYFDKAKEIPNINKELLYTSVGSVLLRSGRLEEALSYFDWILIDNPDNKDASLNKASALIETGCLSLAEYLLHNMKLRYPSDYAIISNLALVYDRRRNPYLAIAWGLRAYNMNNEDLEVLNNLGLYYSHVDDHAVAIDYFDKALGINKNYAPASFNKSKSLFFSGKYTQALDCLEQLVIHGATELGEFYQEALSMKLAAEKEVERRLAWPIEFQ